ncbi:MAG: M20 family metallopeptidase [Fusobacterium sp.]|nr:M20 family metallopeptidase [Fusobacterium sp.]
MKREELYKVEENLANEIENINEYIFNHPELGNEEFISSKYLVEKLREHNFEVVYPYLELNTSFRAEFKKGNGRFKIAFLAEYDALPGYGVNKDENAHACGHNWIAASTLGAAMTLAKSNIDFEGTIVVIGTPAEETVGGKCELVKKGAFEDIDAVIQMHLGAETNINVTTLAMDSIEFNFKGLASHAAAYPEKGINALDAVNLMFAGVNALRQHVRSDSRIAGIINNGGSACNIVPDKASCKYYIRASEREYLEELTQKIINCAKGAALMTGAELDYCYFENSYDNLVYNESLRKLLKQNLIDLGVENFVPEDKNASGSSDIGNVSMVCPTVYCEIDTGARPKVFAHHETFLDYVHGENAKNTLHISTKAMAYTALQIFLDKELLKK